MNSDLSDIAAALTASLARDGQGGMTAVLPLSATGFTYSNDTNTGMYRSGADAQSIKCGGSDIVEVTTSGIDVAGQVKQNGNIILPIGLGPLPWSGLSAPSGWVLCYGQSLSRTTYSQLWTFAQAEIANGNTLFTNGDGTTTFTILDLRGRMPAGKDDMGGTAASRLTSATMTPNGNTLGASGGDETATIEQTNLPNITLATAIAAGQGSHTHVVADVIIPGGATDGNGVTVPLARGNRTSNASTLPAMSGTTPLGGSGTALDNVQPTIITNYILYAGV